MLTMIDDARFQFLASAALVALIMAWAGYLAMGWRGMVVAGVSCLGTVLIFRIMPKEIEGADSSTAESGSPPDLLDNDSFTRIIDGLSDPMMVIDRGKVALANSAAIKLLGGHIVGADARIAIRHPAVAERLADSRPLEQTTTIDVVGLGTRDQRWSMQIVPVDTAADGQRLLVHLIDDSARYAVERARVDFVANASHELRTPLSAILGFVETLGDPKAGGDPPTRQRFLKIVEGEARRMEQLVDDLMSLSRIEADKHRLPDTEIDLSNLAREVVDIMRVTLGERGKDIRIDAQAGLPPVQADRAQISQLLHNLIDNAAKYGRPGSPVTVSTTALSPSMIRLEVADQGEGIPREHLPRLTERFYRVDSGRSRVLGGTGLGLAIVKHIVERHRGRLDIASTPGKGTTVTIHLPCIEAPALPPALSSK